MRPALLFLAVLFALAPSQALSADLLIAGSTDRAAMQPLLDAFVAENPGLEVDYLEGETVDLYERLRAGGYDTIPDVIVSSAADLQIRLVNDGYTRSYASPATERLPEWAVWRNEAFGFTFEPLVFVVNPGLVPPENRPRTREELGRLVAAGGEDGPKVATYDVRESGVGYLAASWDAITMSDFWPFMERVSGNGLLTTCCTSNILDMVASGRALVGLNVLGSYARQRADADGDIAIVVPEDFTLVITRVAVLPAGGRNPAAGERFLDFLLSPVAQTLLGPEALIGRTAERALSSGPIRPIPLGATLLALTDPMRRSQFIALWTEVTGAEP